MTGGRSSSGIVNTTVIGWSCVMTTRPFGSLGWTMLPTSSRRSPPRPRMGAVVRAYWSWRRAGDAALHRDGVEGEHRAEPGQVHRHVAFSRRRRHHGHARADRLAGRLGGGRLPARPGGAQLVGGPGEEEEGHEPGPAAGPRP